MWSKATGVGCGDMAAGATSKGWEGDSKETSQDVHCPSTVLMLELCV